MSVKSIHHTIYYPLEGRFIKLHCMIINRMHNKFNYKLTNYLLNNIGILVESTNFELRDILKSELYVY